MRTAILVTVLALWSVDAGAQEELRLRSMLTIEHDAAAVVLTARDDGMVGIGIGDLVTREECLVRPSDATRWAAELRALTARTVEVSPGEESRIQSPPVARDCNVLVRRSTTNERTRYEVLRMGPEYSVRVPVTSGKMNQFVESLAATVDSADAMFARALVARAAAPEPAYLDFQVERVTTLEIDSPVPAFPEVLRAAGIDGRVMAQFIVDTLGRVESASVIILRASHELFEASVRQALPALRFMPAMLEGRRVRQQVEQPFDFTLDKQ